MTVDIAAAASAEPSLDGARAVLAKALSDQPSLASRFPWAREAVAERTEAFVARHLSANKPGMLTWQPISDHLRALGYHLEQCQARQEKLFDLEASCIGAVVDSLNADRLIAIDEKLATAEAVATARASGASEAEARQLVSEKFAIRQSTLELRQTHFSTSGSPLNFNERIALLRRLQADSVHAAYVRATTLRHAMWSNGIARLPAVPSWNANSAGTLGELILWARRAADVMDEYLQYEKTLTVAVSSIRLPQFFKLSDGSVMTAASLQSRLASAGYDEFTFDFSPEMLLKATNLNINRPVRLLSASIGLIFGGSPGNLLSNVDDRDARDRQAFIMNALRDWRSLQRCGGRVTIPKQIADYGNAAIAHWTFKEIHLDDTLKVVETMDGGMMSELPSNRIANINPIGQWRVVINDVMRSPIDNGSLSSPVAGASHEWSKVRGIAMTFRIGFNDFI